MERETTLKAYIAEYLREELGRALVNNAWEPKETRLNLEAVIEGFEVDLEDHVGNAIEAYEGGAR